jgi:hypothetical protein
MITEKIWNSGMTSEEYVSQMVTFQKEMQQRINDLRITSAEFDRLRNIEHGRKLLVLTESRCKDSLMNLPIIMKIAEASEKIKLRIFNRANNAVLASYFASEGLVNIPICWIMNEDLSKRGHWVEKPQKAYRMMDEWNLENPELEKIQNDPTLTEAEKTEKKSPYKDKLLDEMWNWYDTELQSETVKEIYKILV